MRVKKSLFIFLVGLAQGQEDFENSSHKHKHYHHTHGPMVVFAPPLGPGLHSEVATHPSDLHHPSYVIYQPPPPPVRPTPPPPTPPAPVKKPAGNP